jgi:hypothetical protein
LVTASLPTIVSSEEAISVTPVTTVGAPAWEEEVTPSPNNQPLPAVDPRVVDRMDLLTIVEHELGHIAGLNDVDALTDDIMSGVLGAGIRRNAVHTDAVLAS